MWNVARSGANLLGEPDALSSKRHPHIWKYGSLELTFYRLPDGTAPFLVSISLYFYAPARNPPDSLEFTGWSPSHETTFDDFREFLDHSATGSMVASPRDPTSIWSWHPAFVSLLMSDSFTA